MKDIVIIGSGGFGREVAWLLEENNKIKQEWNILGYVSNDNNNEYLKYPILGTEDWLLKYEGFIHAACCVGNAELRHTIVNRYNDKHNIEFPPIISKDAIVAESAVIGKGAIICAGTIITVNVKVGDFSIINLDCTIGHEAELEPFVTMYPNVNVSGNVHIGRETEIGTGSVIIQGIHIGQHAIIGANASVVRNVPEWTTSVGVPAKVIKERNLGNEKNI